MFKEKYLTQVFCGRRFMQIESVENALFSAVNPFLKSIIRKFDVECEKDGSLLINSLKRFLGEDVNLCERCDHLDSRIANPFYEVAKPG
jgi:hypothetical protein